MYNPFIIDSKEETTENEIIRKALDGDKDALTNLISRHQAWIYNIAFRMVMVAEDAEDVTQEILIKIITKLSSYDSAKASFRTWLYRIVKNHVINMKKSVYEQSITSLENYYSFIETTPDEDITPTPETNLIINDLAIGCISGVLLCLERQQRLAFILSIGFNVSSDQGGEILEMSSPAYRKTLSRAKEKLYNFMTDKCGLINENAPCKCRNKVSSFIKQGYYKSDNLKFYKENQVKLNELVSDTVDHYNDTIHADFVKLYRDHAFYDPPDLTEWLKTTLKRKEFKDIFDLSQQK